MKLKEYLFNYNVRRELDDLQARLQADYNGEEPFEQYEEDRIVLGNILDMIDTYEEQNTNSFSIAVNNGGKLVLEGTDNGFIINSIDCNNKIYRRDYISEGDMVMLMNYYRYVKDNDIQDDFINSDGLNDKDNLLKNNDLDFIK